MTINVKPIEEMDVKPIRDPFDYLSTIEKVLREAPRVQKNGGVLVAEILDDTCTAFAEFIRELLEGFEQAEQEFKKI